MAAPGTRRVGFLAFDGMQALDLFGPLDVFDEATNRLGGRHRPYEIVVASETGKSVTTASGVGVAAQCALTDCPKLNTLIIPGGVGSRGEKISQAVVDWVGNQAKRGVRTGSVCTGIFILARTGLLDGKRATTHWHHVDEAREAFPAVTVEPDALFIREGDLFTAAGVTAGIDVALSLVEEDHGHAAASLVARHLVVFLKRPGDQRQFSSLLDQQTRGGDAFGDLIAWIADNLGSDLSSFSLSERVGLSERQFRRKFQELYGETPTRRIERIRVESAREWLLDGRSSVEKVARLVGFQSADTFRRAFERHHGVAPSAYRERFAGRSA